MTPLLPTPEHYLYNLITMNSSMSKKMWRKALKEHFDCTCVYCGKTYELSNLTLDHVVPRSAGGETIASNIVPACQRCNQKKASKPISTPANAEAATPSAPPAVKSDGIGRNDAPIEPKRARGGRGGRGAGPAGSLSLTRRGP